MNGYRDKKEQELYWQRERIATAVLQGLVTCGGRTTEIGVNSSVEYAVLTADKLIKELNKEA